MPSDIEGISERVATIRIESECQFLLGSRSAAIERVREAVAHNPQFTAHEIDYLTRIAQIWEHSLNTSYIPPQNPSESDLVPLLIQFLDSLNLTDEANVLELAWRYLNHVELGTARFQSSLAMLAHMAHIYKKDRVALGLSGIAVAHFQACNESIERWERELSDADKRNWMYPLLPVEVALERLANDPSPIWITTVEQAISRNLPGEAVENLSRALGALSS